MTVLELREKRAGIRDEACKILDAAEAEDRQMSGEETQQYTKMMDEVDALKVRIEQREKQEALELEMNAGLGRKTDPEQPGAGGDGDGKTEVRTMLVGKDVTGAERRIPLVGPLASDEYRTQFGRFLLDGEKRALKAGDDAAGGYTLAPIQWMGELIQALDNLVWMRQICRVLPPVVNADSLGTASLDNDPADPTWVSELNIGTEDSTMTFGGRELHPHPLAQFIKVSKKLLRSSVMNVDQIVRDRLAYKNAVVEENAFLNGDGASSPLGLFTASDLGIGTGRDVSTGNTATDVRTDGLKECKWSLKAQYRRNSSWVWNRTGLKRIDKLKDGDGRYIWQPGVVAGAPDTLLARPIYESEYVPDTWSGSGYVGILGDFSHYWIVDALTMTVQVLIELYAGANQNGYLSRRECDGMPVLAEAFARVQLV